MATIVAALGAVLHSNRGVLPMQDVEKVLSTVERCLALDRLLPSFGNVVTIAGLQVSEQTSPGWDQVADPFSNVPDATTAAVPGKRIKVGDVSSSHEVSTIAAWQSSMLPT